MTEFLFVRHGESTANINPLKIGGQNSSVPLTEKGRQQAADIGTYLRETNERPTAIYSSGAVRTNQTAAIALESAGITLPVVTDARLLEVSQGPYEGTLKAVTYGPVNVAKYRLTSLEGKLPGGESIADAQARMVSFVHDVSREFPDGRILVFGHGLAIRSLAGYIEGLSKMPIVRGVTDNVSLTAMSTAGDTITVQYLGKNVIPEYT